MWVEGGGGEGVLIHNGGVNELTYGFLFGLHTHLIFTPRIGAERRVCGFAEKSGGSVR